jgi:thiosulfate/3-mercaptopyruvate sulfurtransferase
MGRMKILVDKEWLKENIDHVRVVDCRFNLGNSDEGQQLYLQNHIPGAIYAHLEKDLSGDVSQHGGRHPLPDLKELTKFLEGQGINRETKVVAYDDGNGAFAARFWWLLSYVGHEHVAILNGGYKGWQESQYSVDSCIPSYETTQFTVSLRDEMIADMEDVKRIVSHSNDQTVLIDSREERRYIGEFEPIDRKAGHIPGAVNKVWTEGMDNGYFKEAGKQKERFSEWDPKQPIIVYCGSGVTAAPNYIALKQAGFEHVKLYLGSFSDWISYDENPVAKTEKRS